MKIYRGGYSAIKTPEIRKGEYTKVFGTGFYCTKLKNQATRWAKRYKTPIVSGYRFQINRRLKILKFTKMTEEWLDFIVNCRQGIEHDYDIVIGPMADDQIYNYIADFLEGSLTREQFWALAQFKNPTHQINFCTESALKCLTFVNSKEVKYERKGEKRV